MNVTQAPGGGSHVQTYQKQNTHSGQGSNLFQINLQETLRLLVILIMIDEERGKNKEGKIGNEGEGREKREKIYGGKMREENKTQD